jgi:hypothetical protein
VLDNELLAGNELSLAMLEIDATSFASDVDRKQAVRAKYDAVRWRFGLSSLVYRLGLSGHYFATQAASFMVAA